MSGMGLRQGYGRVGQVARAQCVCSGGIVRDGPARLTGDVTARPPLGDPDMGIIPLPHLALLCSALMLAAPRVPATPGE